MAADAPNVSHYVDEHQPGPAQDTDSSLEIDLALPNPEICVICLDRIHEKAIALPCKHDQFDFPCLGTWMHQQRNCPLCKAEVKAIEYNVGNSQKSGQIFYLPIEEASAHNARGTGRRQGIERARGRTNGYHPYSRGRGRNVNRLEYGQTQTVRKDDGLDFRRLVYRDNMFSLHVGSNRISRYRNVTPATFQRDAHLISRAKSFVRRELSVFDFLNPSSASFGSTDRRASNAEFLLEYIVSILKTIDLKGSAGQAEELLSEFLGRNHSKLFLHELEAWLRSPFERLQDWDRAVQYSGHSHNGSVRVRSPPG